MTLRFWTVRDRYPNADHNLLEHIASLRLTLAGLLLLSLFLTWALLRAQGVQKVEIPPDVRNGAVVQLGQTQPFTAYDFAYVVWQQLNLWREDGATDYRTNLGMMRPYLTPACYAELDADRRERASHGELQFRTRSLQPVGPSAYLPARVRVLGPDAWEVTLDFLVSEQVRGQTIKDAPVRYRLQVVTWDRDTEQNPWGLALDCFTQPPERIAEAPTGNSP